MRNRKICKTWSQKQRDKALLKLEQEMAGVLGHTLSRDRIDAAACSILARMNRFQAGRDIVIAIANALCLTSGGGMVDRAYQELLR